MNEKQKKNDNQLKRGLNRRHLQMIAIGGSIGTGLFLAMGGTIRSAWKLAELWWDMPSWELSYTV